MRRVSTPSGPAAVRQLHDACRGLAGTLPDALAALDVNWVGLSADAGDDDLAHAIADARACLASMHAAVTHLLALEHSWDEAHLPHLATRRPVLMVDVPLGPDPRDAWRRAVASLAYGARLGAAAVAELRSQARLPKLSAAVQACLGAADAVAAALEAVEPLHAEGVPPAMWAAEPVLDPDPTSDFGTTTQRLPSWRPTTSQ
jgi:hypothetical protein